MNYPRHLFAENLRQCKTMRSFAPRIAMEHWGLWFAEGLESLTWLHNVADSAHGSLCIQSFHIGEDMHLRIRPSKEALPANNEYNPSDPTYPPEMSLWSGKQMHLDFDRVFDDLDKSNYSFELIQNQFSNLGYEYKPLKTMFEILESAPDPKKADVWSFAIIFLTTYLDYLSWEGIMNSVFYKYDHRRFMNLLETMLKSNPSVRSSAESVFQTWCPPISDDECDGSDDECDDPSNLSQVGHPSEIAVTVSESQTQHPQPAKRRLVLKRSSDPAVRNKTRRSRYS